MLSSHSNIKGISKCYTLTDGSIHKTTLTKINHAAILNAPRNIEVEFCSSFRIGDNTPQDLAVFLCPSFFKYEIISFFKFIMTVLFEQPLRLVVPIHDTANSLNTVTKCFAALRDGLTTQRIGITAS